MQALTRGQKVKLADLTSSQQLGVGVGIVAPGLNFDISCFGVDASNQLSDDRYFVFYNQKSSPEGAIRQMGAQSGDAETFALDLNQLPATIRKLVFVFTIDGAGSMSSLQNGYIRLVASGTEIAKFSFSGSDFSTEKAVIAAEIYFKDVWRVAAVGQGFAGGLSALLAHFGGQETEEAAAPPPPVAQTPAAPVMAKAAVTPPPPLAPSSAATNPVAAQTPVVTAKSGPISLVKGQPISLEKAAGEPLTKVFMGLGWDVGRGYEIDLDASCLLFDANKKNVESVWFCHLKSKDGSVVHSGDNLTGAGSGDDERIMVDLSQVPAHVQTLVFTVNSFLGANFSHVENAFCRLVNASNQQEIARYNLSTQGSHRAQVMAKLYRQNGEWQMAAIGAPASARTFHGMMPAIREHL